ncbi:YceI family protein [Ornithinimicrobium pekingense]|uniref:Polyisoprenoid-binding protein n=1 Tax=Ornithinimicrobium pekingense TaxID=384677 RepID=A0ABQ2FA99_9MICO|nr:YceI family protein [Ornithinimicrobium pekingense]GGK68127.1 polyisoprenoid-binding protein [Ornithinimicrobium pekingense]
MGLFDWFRKSTPEHTPAATAPAAPSTDVLTAERGTVEETPVSPAAADLSGTWSIDPGHSSLGFSARHAMVTNVRGQFDELEGTGVVDAANPSASHATVVLQAASINTGVADRDAHLRSADFFDVETYPELRFVSTAVELVDGGTWRVTGDLTIKDVTRPVTVDLDFTGLAQDPFGNLRAGFEGQTTINRKDWGLEWNAALETGGVLVGEKVKLSFDISAIRSS